jgi:opacity protein-like surface antigen
MKFLSATQGAAVAIRARSTLRLLLTSMLLIGSMNALAADKVSGTVAFKTWTGAIKFAALVRGPDEMDESKSVLRIYLSSSDISAKIKACKTFSCADAALTDGAMVDFGDARHLGYAVRLNNERAQYSGGTDASAFALTANKSDHLAGKVHIDDAASGGAKVDADFDLALMTTFKSVR